MTKTEELRERLLQAIGTYGVAENKGMPSELCETLNSLITAAREEGAAQEHQKIANDIADILFNAQRPFLDVVLRNLKEEMPEVYGDSLPVKEK